jgi:cell fate regulator YaaT (PSP1 superfamily)
MNTYDWLAKEDYYDPSAYDIVEVSFKNGTRKEFYKNQLHTYAVTGDQVAVESSNGYDVGRISLSGELVRAQMKKKRVKEEVVKHKVLRVANERDLEKLMEARRAEKPTMIKARAIARSLDVDMKIGEVEYQGDKRKATFYYTADGRVDFRELIRHFAKEFRIKIEMRQIGARQESALIGGLGSCGRELCCSTWLTDFKSVSTTAARYQNLAINQSKLSGQCGRLKCCLNFELDTYMEALEDFPKRAEKIYTEAGRAMLIKTNIFKRLMYYVYEKPELRGRLFALDVNDVKDILAMNKKGEKPMDLQSLIKTPDEVDKFMDYEDVTGVVELPAEKRKKKSRNKNRNRRRNDNKLGDNSERRNDPKKDRPDSSEEKQNKDTEGRSNNSSRRRGNKSRNTNKPGEGNKSSEGGKSRNNKSRHKNKPRNTNKPPQEDKK